MTDGKISDLKMKIVDQIPAVLKHQTICECDSPACKLNLHLMHFFLATEFDYLRPKDSKDEALSEKQKLI